VLVLAGCASTPPLSLPTLGTALPDPAHTSGLHDAGAPPAHDLIGALADQLRQAPFYTESTASLLVPPIRNATGRPVDVAGLSAAFRQALTAAGPFTLVQMSAQPAAVPPLSREQRLLGARASGARYCVQGVLELDESSPAAAGGMTLRVEVTDLATSLVVWMVRQSGALPAPIPAAVP